MFFQPKDGHGLPHNPFQAIVAPRPIGWISTLGADGIPNLAPYSYFNAFSSNPPIVGFSSDGMKHSAGNTEASGEFVVNLATRKLAEAMNMTSAAVPEGANEFELAGLEAEPGRIVSAPRVKEAAAALECKVTQVLRILNANGDETSYRLVLGQVVGIHIDEQYLTDGLFDIVKAGTISRLGYRDYAQVTGTFSMARPGAADKPSAG